MIRVPRPHEIRLLPQIENSADLRYAAIGLAIVVAMPPASLAALETGRRDGRLWVATPGGRPVGFALMTTVGGTARLPPVRGHGTSGATHPREM